MSKETKKAKAKRKKGGGKKERRTVSKRRKSVSSRKPDRKKPDRKTRRTSKRSKGQGGKHGKKSKKPVSSVQSGKSGKPVKPKKVEKTKKPVKSENSGIAEKPERRRTRKSKRSAVPDAGRSEKSEKSDPEEVSEDSEKPKKSSKRKTIVTVLLLFLACGLLALGITLVVVLYERHFADHPKYPLPVGGPENRNTGNPVCSSPECVLLSHQLRDWRDPQVDPCVDFYKATCGKYAEHTMADGSRMDYRKGIMMDFMKEYLAKSDKSAPKWERTMRAVYEKCEQLKTNPTLDERDLRIDFEKHIMHMGRWPTSTLGPSSNFNLSKWLYRAARGTPHVDLPFFTFRAHKKLLIRGPNTDDFGSEEELIEYARAIISRSESNITQYVPIIKEDVRKVIEFHEKIVQLNQKKENMLTYNQLKSAVPKLDMDWILEPLINVSQVSTDDSISVFNTELFTGKPGNLATLLDETPDRVLANYIVFKLMSDYFNLKGDPPTGSNLLWKRRLPKCEELVVETMPQSAVRVFVRSHSHRENIGKLAEMIAEIKGAFVDMFKGSEWLSDSSKTAVLLKLETMVELLQFPDEKDWEPALEAYYEERRVGLDFATLRYSLNRMLFLIRKHHLLVAADNVVNSTLHPHFQPTDDYFPLEARLAVIIAILNDPIGSYPKYARSAVVGRIVAHAIGHGFDRDGVELDANGEGNALMGASREDVARYSQNTRCLVDQYTAYDDPDFGKKLVSNPKITGELIADHLAITTALQSHKKLDKTQQPHIVGFEGTDADKMFFHIAALDYCSPPSKPPLNKDYPTNSFRVNGVFSNMKEFGEAFKCPVGSPMNPKNKCELF